jgi:endonuclease/exonuclease/phosphatase family metal-dependent hydrolase
VTRVLTVATWNIFGGRVWDGSRVDLDLTLATLRRLGADLVAVQEVDRSQPRSHGVDQARVLGEALGMDWRYAPALLGTPGSPEGWRAPGAGDGDPGGTAYGIALLSRLPLTVAETVLLPWRDRDEPRVAVIAKLADGGRRLTIAGTHLSSVLGPNLVQLRALQRHLEERGGPRLLLGDLNLWWPLVRLMSRPGWRPLARGPTFRNRPPGSPAWMVQLDHVLASGGTLIPRRARIVSGPASDHRAVVVELECS